MTPKQKVTIQDIARQANVSISTVSRVMNNGASVTQAKREAVLKAVAELNYQPNVFAQGLASGQSKIIGVLTPYISSPFYGEIMRGIQEGLKGSGYSTLFSEFYWNFEQGREAIQSLMTRRIDGLIVLQSQEVPIIQLQDLAEQLPIIFIGSSTLGLAEYNLWISDFEGAYVATKYLVDQGHRRIVHITGILTHQDAQERLRGYKQALRDGGLPVDPNLIIEGDFSEQSGLVAVQSLIMRGQTFSAIFVANDQTVYGVRLGLHRHGLRVPEDISIVGFDDQINSAYMIPPLTTVRLPMIKMGQVAAQAILDLLADRPFSPPQFKTELVVRESVARHR